MSEINLAMDVAECHLLISVSGCLYHVTGEVFGSNLWLSEAVWVARDDGTSNGNEYQ